MNSKKNNPDIAPHEGKEIEYVFNGIKPLATLSRFKQPEQYKKALSLSNVICVSALDKETIIITRKENADLHVIFNFLTTTKANVLVRSAKEKHTLLGRLYGYSEEQIKAYIESDMKCACGQCKFIE